MLGGSEDGMGSPHIVLNATINALLLLREVFLIRPPGTNGNSGFQLVNQGQKSGQYRHVNDPTSVGNLSSLIPDKNAPARR